MVQGLMARLTVLEKQWRELMSLCDAESRYRQRDHPKVLKLVTRRIDDLAAEMGFARRQIETREFRAVRSGERIVQIIKDE
jgi:hypothetical protein